MNSTAAAPRLVIATPCYGGMTAAGYTLSLVATLEALRRQGVACALRFLTNESLITRARNTLTAQFLADDSATHLLFIDADIEWSPASVLSLLARDLPLVGGAYPMKQINWPAVARQPTDPASAAALYAVNPLPDSSTADGLMAVRDIGTGFLLIRRDVLTTLAPTLPRYRIQPYLQQEQGIPASITAFFETMIDDDGTYLSEDYAFCRRWQAMGGTVWLDLACQLTHVGNYRFRGSLPALAAAAGGQRLESAP